MEMVCLPRRNSLPTSRKWSGDLAEMVADLGELVADFTELVDDWIRCDGGVVETRSSFRVREVVDHFGAVNVPSREVIRLHRSGHRRFSRGRWTLSARLLHLFATSLDFVREVVRPRS